MEKPPSSDLGPDERKIADALRNEYPEAIRLYSAWIEAREAELARSSEEERIAFEVRKARILAAGDFPEEARLNLKHALFRARAEGIPDLEREIEALLSEIPRAEGEGDSGLPTDDAG